MFIIIALVLVGIVALLFVWRRFLHIARPALVLLCVVVAARLVWRYRAANLSWRDPRRS